jgi:hypothetical protein
MLVLPHRARRCPRSLLGAGTSFRFAFRRTLVAAVPLIAALCGAAACGSGTTDPPDAQVARVEVTAAAASVHEDESIQLTARALTASGAVISGKTFTWQSSNTAVATVDGGGLVRGLARGSATITAAESTSGLGGTLTVTVTPVPVGAVAVSAPQARVKSGKQLPLSAVLTDAGGRVLTGREIAWSTSTPALATVSAGGVLVGKAPGTVIITATSEGKSGSLTVEVFQLPPSRITVPLGLNVLAVGETVQLRAVAVDAEGDTIPAQPPLYFTEFRRAGAAVLAAADGPDVYRGAALGHATVRAEQGVVSSNTAVVAVLASGELLAAALPDGSRNRRVGDRVTVPVVLDMSRAASPGDLGALELEVGYDTTSLALKSATPGISGSISEGGTPGRYRFAFASASPTAATRLTIVTLEFEVTATARPGSSVPLTLTFPSAPASTGFAAYPHPVVATGDVSIVY